MARTTFSRREVLKLGALSVAGTTLAACGRSGSSTSPGASPGRKITVSMFVNSGGHLGDTGIAFAKEYMEQHRNVEIKIVQGVGTQFFPQQLAAFKVDPTKPIINVGWYNATLAGQGDANNMWQKLDYSAMPNAKDVDPAYHRPDGRGIGLSTDVLGLVYNTNAYSTPPTSYADIWDERNRGKVVTTDYWWFLVYATSLLHGGNLQNLDPGWNFVREHADYIAAIASGANQLNQMMATGQANIACYLAGNSLSYKYDNNAPIGFAYPKEGLLANPWYLISSNGNTQEQEEVCRDIINELLSPKWAGKWCDDTLTIPSSKAVKLSSKLDDEPAFKDLDKKKIHQFDWQYVGSKQTEWRANWDRFVKANI